MAGMKNDSIMIDIGFDSNIDSFIKKTEAKLKKANFGGENLNAEISKSLKKYNEEIDKANKKKINIGLNGKELVDALATLENIQNTIKSPNEFKVDSKKAVAQFGKLSTKINSLKEELNSVTDGNEIRLDEDFDVTDIAKYIEQLRNLESLIAKISDSKDLSSKKYDFDALSQAFGIDINDLNDATTAISKEIKSITQIIQNTISTTRTSSDEKDIPLYLRISTSKEVLIEQVKQVVDAVKQYAKNNAIPIKLDLSSTYQGKEVTKQIKELTKLLPDINDPEIKSKIEELQNSLSKNMTEGWSIKINTGELQSDISLAEQAITELENAVTQANEKIVIKPRIDIADNTSKELHSKLKKLTQLLDTDAKKAIDKVNDNINKLGAGESHDFEKNLALIINRFQQLSNNETGLKALTDTFKGMAAFVKKFSDENFLDAEFIENVKALRLALTMHGDNGLGTQLEKINENTAQVERLAESLKNINANLNELDFNKDINLGISAEDISTLKSYTSTLVDFFDSFIQLKKMRDTGELSGNITNFVGAINQSFNSLNGEKLQPLTHFTEFKKSLKFAESDSKGITTAISELETFIATVEKARNDYNDSIEDIENKDVAESSKTVTDVSKNITKLNTTAKPNGVISVLNDVLKRGGELDKLIKLFNSPFGKSVNAPLELPKINTEKAAKSTVDNIYKDGSKLKGLYDKAMKDEDVSNLEALYRMLEKISNEYFDIRKAYKDGFIDEKTFKATSGYTTAVMSELEEYSGFQFPKLKTKRQSVFGMEESKKELSQYITQTKEAAAIEKEVFASLDNEAIKYTKIFNGTFNTIKNNIDSLFTGLDTVDIYNQVKTLYDNFEKIESLNKLGIISNEEFENFKSKLSSIGQLTSKAFDNHMLKFNFDDKELITYDDEIVSLKLNVEQLFNLFDKGASKKEIFSALTNVKQSSNNFLNTKDAYDSTLRNLKEIQSVISDTKNKQITFFKKNDLTNLYAFIDAFEQLKNQYDGFQTKSKQWSEVLGEDKASKITDKTKAEFDALFTDLNNGFSKFIDKIRKMPIDGALKEKFLKIISENPFTSNTSADAIEDWGNRVKIVLNEIGTGLNSQANTLSFNKLLGKIYNDLNKNSNATKAWKDQMHSLADEMQAVGKGGTSDSDLKVYAEQYQLLDTQLKQSGQTGKSFFAKLSDNMQHQTTQLIAMTFSFYRLIGAIRQGFQTVTEFDSALAKISYTMDVSDKQLNAMGNSIIKLSKELSTSISNIQEAYTIYANMNTSPEEIENLTKYTAVLSNLSGLDASTAADDIQSVVNQFENLNSTDTSHIVDVFDYISRNISVDYQKGIEGMAEGVQAVGNVADKAGLSYEQLSAIIAKTMEQTRNSGSSIANGLKTIMVRLSKASSMDDEVDNSTLSKASAVLHDIGVEVYTAEGEFREFDTIMTELASRWDSLTEAQQANISFQIAATRQTAVLKAILQNWTESMDLATGAVNTNGNALENQEKYAETYEAKMQNIKNSLAELSIAAFDDSGFKELLDLVNKLTKAFTNLVDTIGTVPVALGGVATVIAKKFVSFSDITDIYKNTAFKGQSLKELPERFNALAGLGTDSKEVKELINELDIYDKRVVAASLSKSKLNEVEKANIKTLLAQEAALQSITVPQMRQILTDEEIFGEENKLDQQRIQSIRVAMSEAKAINDLTLTKAREILTTNGVVGTEQELVIARMKELSVVEEETGSSLANFAAGINPVIVGLAALAAALYVAKKAYDYFVVTEEEYFDKLNEELDDSKNAISELENLKDNLSDTKNRLKELQNQANQGKLSIIEQEELDKLKEENAELEKNINLQKSKVDKEVIEAYEAATKTPTGQNFTGYQYIEQSKKDIESVAKQLSTTKITHNNLNPLIDLLKGLSEEEAKTALEMSKLDKQTQLTVLNMYKLKYADELTSQAFSDLSLNVSETNFDSIGEAAKSTATVFKNVKEDYKDLLSEDVDEKLFESAQKSVDKYQIAADEKLEELDSVIKAYEDYEKQGHELLPSKQTELNEMKQIREEIAKTMYEATNDDYYFEAMNAKDKFAAFRDSIANRVAIAYGVESEYAKKLLDDTFKYFEEKNIEVPRDFDYSKITLTNKSAQSVKLNNGAVFEFDTTNVSKENKANLQQYVQGMYDNIVSELQYRGKKVNYTNIITQMILRNKIGLKFIDSYVEELQKDIEEAINNQVEPKVKKTSFEEAWKELDNVESDSPLSKMKENLTQLADEGDLTPKLFTDTSRIEDWAKKFGVSTDEATEQIKAFKDWTDKLNISLNETIDEINSLSKDETRMANLRKATTSLQNAYAEKRDAVITNKDNTKQKQKINQTEAASAETINSLAETFGGLDSWQQYKEVLGSTTSTLEECREASNKLLTEYYNKKEIINDLVDEYGNVKESSKEFYVSQLDELGVANAQEVIDKEILQRKIELFLANKDLTEASEDELVAISSEAEALNDESIAADEAKRMINLLILQKITANHTSLAVEGDLTYLQQLATFAEKAGLKISELAQAESLYAQAESLRKIGNGSAGVAGDLFEQAKALEEKGIKELEKQLEIKADFGEPNKDSSSGGSSGGSSSSKNKTKETIDWIERYIEEAQQRIDLSSAKLANTFGEKNQNKLYNRIIKNYGNIAKAYKVAGQKYSKNFNYYVNKKNNKKLFTDDLVDKIKNGRITGDASKLIQTYGEKNGKKIKEAIDRWKKYNDALVKEQEAITNEREKRAEKQQKMADRRQAKSELNKLYAEAEEKGYKEQNSYLKDAEKYERASLKKLLKKAKIEKDVTEQKKIQEQLAQLDNTYAAQAFDNIIAYYDRLKGVIQDRTALTQSLIDLASARGANANISLYRDIKKNDADLMEQNKKEIADAQNALKKLTKGSQEYRDKQAEINNLLVEQNNLLADQAQQNKNILDTYTRYVDAMRNSNNRIANEVNFLDGLLDYAKHTSDEIKGFFTDEGYAALVSARKGLFTSQENAEIDKKNYEIFFNALHDEAILAALDAEKSITLITANGTETIIDSRKELQELVDKAHDDEIADIKSIYDYQSKIVNLEKEKYTEELNLVKKLIDAKKEELDAEKDLHDYQKTISEKATNITNLERQLAAYSGNTSEEGRAKLQSLQQQLKEAQEDLNETEYDRYISDQKSMLEDLQKQYEDAVNKKLEDFMALYKEGIADVNNNMDKGNNALIEVAKQYGYDPQYKEATTGNFGQLKAYMKNNESELYKISGLVETIANNTSSISSSTNGSNIENTNPKVKNRMETTVKVGNDNAKNYMSMVDTVGDSKTILNKIAKIAKDSKYFKKDQNKISDVNKLIKKEYGKALTTEGLKAIAEILDVPYNKNKNGTLWKALKQLGFAKGGIAKLIKRNGDDGIATLKRGEAVLTPLQTKQFQLLTSHLSDINRLVVLQDELLNKQNGNTNVSYGNITFEFNLPNVTDSQQFVSAIQNDVKVQKAIQSVTIDKIYKKSTLYNSKLNSKSIK